MAGRHRPASASLREWILRLVVVGSLTVNAVVHLRLASGFQQAQPAGVGTGTMFRVAAVAAIAAGLYVLLRGSRAAYAVALVVSVSALFAVVLYRYVDVPQIGPIPPMYEPVWYAEKALSAVAEAVGAVAAAAGLVITRRRPRSAGTP